MPEKESKESRAPAATVSLARITIDAPPSKVFEKLSDVAKWNEWRTVGRVQATSTVRPLKAGDTFTYESSFAPGTVKATVLLWGDHALFGLIKGEHNWRVRQTSSRGLGNLFLKGAKTQVTMDQEITGPARFLVSEQSLEKYASQWLLDLKASIEQK